jgi:hypothetical protein
LLFFWPYFGLNSGPQELGRTKRHLSHSAGPLDCIIYCMFHVLSISMYSNPRVH